MKVRRVVVVAWVAGLVLAVAVPAQAKGVSGVTLTGGGQEITFEGSGEPNTNTKLSNLADSARLYQGLESERPPTAAPFGELGLPITARWSFPTSATETTIVVQHLYLDAQDGPIGHFPGDQELWGEIYPDAWVPLGSDIAEDLAAVGFDIAVTHSKIPAQTIEPSTTAVSTATAVREATAIILPTAASPDRGVSESTLPRLIILSSATAVGVAIAISGIMRRRIQRVA